jgi:hypothetical protein
MYLRLGMGRNDRVILYYIIAGLLKETQQAHYNKGRKYLEYVTSADSRVFNEVGATSQIHAPSNWYVSSPRSAKTTSL